ASTSPTRRRPEQGGSGAPVPALRADRWRDRRSGRRCRAWSADCAEARGADGWRHRLRERGRSRQPLLVHASRRAGARRRAGRDAGEGGGPQGRLSGHVLVVEDNAVNRMLIGTYLEEFGLTHEMVDSGGGAVMNLATKTYDL